MTVEEVITAARELSAADQRKVLDTMFECLQIVTPKSAPATMGDLNLENVFGPMPPKPAPATMADLNLEIDPGEEPGAFFELRD